MTAPDDEQQLTIRGFDDYELRLGDLMRGERATLGKSLLDVQRDLKIKASYIAAIENADLDAFDTPGFVPGYVRAYARYLGMDPEWAWTRFCAESGFRSQRALVGGPAAESSTRGRTLARASVRAAGHPADEALLRAPWAAADVPRRALFEVLDLRALGSILVMVLLLGGISYGGWKVFEQIQRVRVAPPETAPAVVAELDPLEGAGDDSLRVATIDPVEAAASGHDGLAWIDRPEPLAEPLVVPRDGPIARLDPATLPMVGPEINARITRALEPASAPRPAGQADSQAGEAAAPGVEAAAADEAPPVRVTVHLPQLALIAVGPAWVRVRDGEGAVLVERILDAGEVLELPESALGGRLRTGNAGALFVAAGGRTFGPLGASGQVVKNVPLEPEAIAERFAEADPGQHEELATALAMAGPEEAARKQPQE